MRVTLEIVAGPDIGRRVFLRSGQLARFGRTQWADFSFERDTEMADVHFAINCTPQECVLKGVGREAAVLLDGAPVAEAMLTTGGRITAGKTEFLVRIEGQSAPVEMLATPAAPSQAPAIEAAPIPVVEPPRAAPIAADKLVRHAKLSEPARALLSPQHAPQQFHELLLANELWIDALRFRAHWLPQREAVWWSCLAARMAAGDALAAQDAQAIEAAEQWVADPTPQNSRAAEAHAEAIHYESPAGWCAAAAFWSGESIAPAGGQAVTPAEHLTGTAVAACVTMAAAPGLAAQRVERYRRMLKLAAEVAQGEHPWPKKK
jgi:hypothetical protein